MREHLHHTDEFDAFLQGSTRRCAVHVAPKPPGTGGIPALNQALEEYAKDGLFSIQDAYGIQNDMKSLSEQERADYGDDLRWLTTLVGTVIDRSLEAKGEGVPSLPELPAGHADAYHEGLQIGRFGGTGQRIMQDGVSTGS